MITVLTICTVAVIVMLWSIYYMSRDTRKYHRHYLIEADTYEEALRDALYITLRNITQLNPNQQ